MKIKLMYRQLLIKGIIFFLFSNLSNAQVFEADPHRGMYVDKLCMKDNSGNFIPGLSILGNAAREDSLLRFAQKYHFTYLCFYDLSNIFGDPVLEGYLCSLIDRARNIYCISQVGVVVGGNPCNTYSCVASPAINFGQSFFNSINLPSNIISLAQQVLPETDPDFWLSENLKLAIRTSMLRSTCSVQNGTPLIDVFSEEHEFWGADNPTLAYSQIINYLDDLAIIRNNLNPSAIIEVYLAAYNNSTVSGKSIQDIANDIDGTSPKRADRIIMTYYKPYLDSTTENGATDKYFIYSNNPTITGSTSTDMLRSNSFRSNTTSNSTDFHPLFSAESFYNGGEGNYQGNWLNKTRRNNIFMAEKKFYDQWRNDGNTLSSITNENKITPGGIMWFSSSFLNDELFANPPRTPEYKLFYSSGPVESSSNGLINFTYIGPIEKGIHYEFNIINKLTCAPVSLSGFPAIGVSGDYIPETNIVTSSTHPYSTTILLPGCNLPQGNYIATLKLQYSNCDVPVSYSEEINVVNKPTIVMLDKNEQCEGKEANLICSRNGNSVITWYKVGNSAPIIPKPSRISMSHELVVTESGQYYACVGSCSGSGFDGKTNVIDVAFKSIDPPIVTTDGCATNSIDFKLTTSASNYLWNDNTTSSFVSRTVPSNATRKILHFKYDNNGCTKIGAISYDKSITNTAVIAPAITATPSTFSCAGQSVVATTTGCCGNYSVRQYAWKDKTGSDAINNVTLTNSGNYKVWCKSPGGCRTLINPSSTPMITISNFITASNSVTLNDACGNTNIISLNANTSLGGSSFDWQGPSFTSTVSNPLINGASGSNNGLYVVSANVGGCNTSAATSVSELSDITTFDIISYVDNCEGKIHLTAGCNQQFETYLWSNGATTQNITVTISGTYSVTVEDFSGCTFSSSITVVVPTATRPIITPSSNSPMCAGSSLSLNVGVSGGSLPYIYEWAGPSNFYQLSNTSSVSISNATSSNSGNYQVTVTDANGCIETQDLICVVNELPQIPATPTSGSPQCQNLGVDLFHTTPPAGEIWYWQTTTTGTSTASSISPYTVTNSSPYYLRSFNSATGCWSIASTSVTPTIYSLPLTPVISGNNSPRCSTDGVTLTHNTPPPGETWYWQTAPNGTSTTTPQLSYVVFNTGTYYLRAQNLNGCWSTNSASTIVNVTAMPAANAGTYPASICAGASLPVIGSISNGTILTWSTTGDGYFDNPLNLSTIYTPGQNEINSGSFTISLTSNAPFPCSASVSTISISIDKSCCGNPSSLSYTGGSVSGGQYNVVGPSININTNVTIAGAELFIPANFFFYVGSGGVLTIEDSHLHACGDMWGGIINNGGIVIVNNNSLIEDAITAISSTNGNRVVVTGARFNKNFYDIALSNGSFPSSQTAIYGNLFDCSANISKVPHVNQITRTHIQLDNVTDLVVGDATRNANTFLKGAVGINANYSSLFVFHNDFNPQNGKSCAIRGKGAGEGKDGNMIVVGGAGTNELNTFANAGWGVQCNGVEKVNSYYNYFTNCHRGISLTTIRESVSNNNAINNFYNGIEIYDAIFPTPGDLCCAENHIVAYNNFNQGLAYGADLVNYGNAAIDIRNKIPQFTPVTVSTNSIWNSAIGIHFLNSNSSKAIDGNSYDSQIPFDQTTADHYGIWVQNSNRVNVIGNNIIWSGPFASGSTSRDLLQNQKGIAVARSFKCVFEENAVRNFAAGFNVFDDCTNDNLYCNLMDNCYNGLFLDDQNPNNRMTDQGVPVFTGVFYEHDLSTTWNNRWKDNIDNKVDGLYNQSAFRWLYSDAPYDPEYAPIPSGPMITPLSCLLSLAGCTTPTSFVDDEKRKEAFGKAVGDSSETEIDSVEYAHGDKAFFYKQAKDNPEYLNLGYPTDVLYQLKYNLIAQTNIGKFEDIKASLSSKEIQEAISKLNSMQNLNSIDENNKFISELIALGYDVDLDMDSDTIALVTSIALQHPFYGGEAVYMARAMLRIDVHDQLPQYRKANRPKGVKSITNSVVVYPNPTTDIVTIFSNLPFVESELRIYNSYGKELRLLKISDQQNMFNFSLDEFPSGIYSIKISSKNVLLKQDKIVLIK